MECKNAEVYINLCLREISCMALDKIKKCTQIMKRNLTVIFCLLFFGLQLRGQIQTINPDSTHIKGRNIEYFDSTSIPSDKAIGGNIFLGKGFLSGNLSKYFSNPFFVGINIEIHRKNLIIQIDDYIGFGKTSQTLTFENQKTWEIDDKAFHFMFGCNLGYNLIDTKNIKLVPIGGMGVNLLSSRLLGSSDNSSNEPFLPYLKIGMFMDFKYIALLQEHIRINNFDHNYTSLRLSVGYAPVIGKPKYQEYYGGSIFYITLGMGGLSRNFYQR